MPDVLDPPDPPNPIFTAAAQTGSNISSAIANSFLNNVNQVTPYGNLSIGQTGTYQHTDPLTGGVYGIPQFTMTQTLTPMQQAILDQQQGGKYNLAALANEQSYRLRGQFATPFSIAGAPAYGDPNKLAGAQEAQTTFGAAGDPIVGFGDAGAINRTFADAGQVNSTFGQAGPITKTYGDFASERDRIESGLMERLNPSLAIERNKYVQQLADQGINYGSPAYENAMRNYSMQANDARLGVIGAAGTEQQRMADMAAQRAGFQNSAQQQEYLQQLGRGEFANKAQQQTFEQAQARGEFANTAQQQQYEQLFGRSQFFNAGQQQKFAQEAARGTFANAALAQNFSQDTTAFNAQNAQRNQWLNEQFALRNQPINEISALMSGSQVQQPNFLNSNTNTIANTDVAGILNNNFNQQMQVSNQQAALANQVIGGLFGFGGQMARAGAFGGAG